MQLKFKMEVLKDFKNDLLKRREVKVIIHAKGNPGFEGATKTIDEQFKASPEVTIIKGVKSKFGRDSFLIDAFIYDSVKDKERIEPKPKVEKEKAEPAPAAAPVAEEKKEEAVKEEVKEEKPEGEEK